MRENTLDIRDTQEIINHNDLVENRSQRKEILKQIRSISTLESVKTILTINNSDFITIEMASKYFEVPKQTINKLIERNKEELEENGLQFYGRREVASLNGLNGYLEKVDRYKDKIINGDEEIIVTNRGIMLLSKRLLLNIGMLLRDSVVAKELRKKLLDITFDAQEGVGSIETTVAEIDEEVELKEELFNAMVEGDWQEIARIQCDITKLKNKRIIVLEKQVETLNDTIQDIVNTELSYETLRRELVANLKGIAKTVYNNNFSKTYANFYKFLFDNGYNLELRRTKTIKQLINQCDDLDIERTELTDEKEQLKIEIKRYKRTESTYKELREMIKTIDSKLEQIKKEYKTAHKEYNHLNKCTKLDLLKEEEYKEIISITRSWSLSSGYDWREGLDDTQNVSELPF